MHIGARTDTTLLDESIFDDLNLNYSKRIWKVCATRQIPLIYASSAATYGDGSLGFDDDHDKIQLLKPLSLIFGPWIRKKNHLSGLAVNFLMCMVPMSITKAEWHQ